jgi:hypothetical protein
MKHLISKNSLVKIFLYTSFLLFSPVSVSIGNNNPKLAHPIINIDSVNGIGKLFFYQSNEKEGGEYCGGRHLGIIAKIVTKNTSVIIDCYDLYNEMPEVLTVFLRKEDSNFKYLYILTSSYIANAASDGKFYQVHKYDLSKSNLPRIELDRQYSCFEGYSYEEKKKITCSLKNAGDIKKLLMKNNHNS